MPPAGEGTSALARIPRPVRLAAALLYGATITLWAGAWMYAIGTDPPARIGVEWDVEPRGDGLVLTDVPAGLPGEAAGLRRGDRLLAVDGHSLRHSTLPLMAALYRGPGAEVVLEVERGGDVEPVVLRLAARRGSRHPEGLAHALSLVMNLYPFWFVTVGMAVLFQRLDDGHAWLLALMFGAFAVSAPWFIREAALPDAFRGAGAAVALGLGWQSPALFYAFFATFPTRSTIDRRAPWLKWLLIAAIAAVTAPLLFGILAAGSPAPAWDALGRLAMPPTSTLLSLYQLGAFALGMAALLQSAWSATDPEARRKARVMMWGTLAGLGPIMLLNAVAVLLGEMPPVASGLPGPALPFWLWGLAIVCMLLWPLSFGYAVVKHRVLEMPLLLRRSARYLLVQRGFLVLVALLSVAASGVVIQVFTEVGQRRGGLAAPAGTAVGILFGAGLVFTGNRVHRRVARRIDRAFFREAYDARRLLEELTERTRDVESRVELARLLDESLRRALQPTTSDVFLATPSGRLEHFGDGSRADLDADAVLAELGSGDRLRPRVGPDAALASLSPPHPECLVPLPGRRRGLLGLIALGPRLSEEPYSREDRALLAAVASQAGLTLEGIALAEQIADRLEAERRTAREMEIAREVQRKLLPQETVRTPHLSYAARCVQARAVGGDYWDVQRLDGDRLALVLADISGKGISAALLMANLQASLRSRSPEAFGDPVALLRGLNGQLCASTEASRYATLFLGVWEDASRRLRYVCCGHGPPLVLRASGRAERIEPTASVLGLFEDWDGEVAETGLEDGDWLVLYTDGVTDALDPAGDEFGEDRLIEALAAHAGEEPAGALEGVFGRLDDWGAGAEQWDDQTLLLARAGTPPGSGDGPPGRPQSESRPPERR